MDVVRDSFQIVLISGYLNEMKFTEGPGRAIFSTVMAHQQTQVLI